MATSIKSGATSDLWTIDPTAKAGRGTLYDSSGNLISSSNPLPATWDYGVDDNSSSGLFSATFKGQSITISSPNLPQYIIKGSTTKLVKIIRIFLSVSATTGVACDFWGAKFGEIVYISSANGPSDPPPVTAKADSNGLTPTAIVQNDKSQLVQFISQIDGFYFAERYIVPTGAATGPLPLIVDLNFSPAFNMKPIILRGNQERFGVNISATPTSGTLDLTYFWVEE